MMRVLALCCLCPDNAIPFGHGVKSSDHPNVLKRVMVTWNSGQRYPVRTVDAGGHTLALGSYIGPKRKRGLRIP